MSTYPNIAVLSSTNISGKSATGSLMNSLFKNWPKEKLVQVTKYYDSDEVAQQYQTPFPFYDFLEKQRQSNNPVTWLAAATLRKALFPLKLRQGNKKAVLQHLRQQGTELLYLRVEAEPFYFLTLALYLQHELQVPLVLHFMDDFGTLLEKRGKKNPVQGFYARFYARAVQTLVGKAAKVLVISESMKERYEGLYDKETEVFHNGIYPDLFEKMKPENFTTQSSEPFRFFWAGTIAEHKDDVIIKAIAQAIQTLSESRPEQIEFLLNVPGYSMGNAKNLASQFSCVRYQGYQPMEEYHRLLATSEVLIIGRNFDALTRAYTELSFHNKLPDFLSARRPIAVIGPEWDNTVRVFNKYQFGPVVSSDDPNVIAGCFADILDHYGVHLQKAREASDRAFPLYNMVQTRNRFETALKALV